MNEKDLYSALLALAGGLLAAYSYYMLESIPLTALGIGVAVTGISLLITASESPYRSYMRQVLEASLSNVARVLEEFGVKSKAIYVPGKEGVKVLIPLLEGSAISDLDWVEGVQELAASINGMDYLVFSTPPISRTGGDVEAALSEVLIDFWGLCDSVKVFEVGNSKLTIEVSGAKVDNGPGRLSKVMGSPISYIASSLVAENLNKPVRFLGERVRGKKLLINLEVLGGYGFAPQG